MAHGDITHIDIPVSDFAAAAQFYSELFGWQIAEMAGFEGYPMWQAPNKISGGGLAPRSEDPSPTRPSNRAFVSLLRMEFSHPGDMTTCHAECFGIVLLDCGDFDPGQVKKHGGDQARAISPARAMDERGTGSIRDGLEHRRHF